MDFYGDGFNRTSAYNLIKERSEKPNLKDKYCVYSLSYFVPLNFWNIKSNEGYIKKLLKSNNEYDKTFADILIRNEWFGSLLYSYNCTTVSGFVQKD